MRHAIAFSVILTLLAGKPAAAGEDLADKLVGSWRVVSLKMSYVGENTEQDVLGANPSGRIVYSADRHFAVFVSRRDRKPPHNDADATALLHSMVAYTGAFRIEGDRVIYTIDGAWNEVLSQGAGPHTPGRRRYLDVDGARATAEHFFPGQELHRHHGVRQGTCTINRRRTSSLLHRPASSAAVWRSGSPTRSSARVRATRLAH